MAWTPLTAFYRGLTALCLLIWWVNLAYYMCLDWFTSLIQQFARKLTFDMPGIIDPFWCIHEVYFCVFFPSRPLWFTLYFSLCCNPCYTFVCSYILLTSICYLRNVTRWALCFICFVALFQVWQLYIIQLS